VNDATPISGRPPIYTDHLASEISGVGAGEERPAWHVFGVPSDQAASLSDSFLQILPAVSPQAVRIIRGDAVDADPRRQADGRDRVNP